MKTAKIITREFGRLGLIISFLLTPCLPPPAASAQVSREDLEGLERHRSVRQRAGVMQSIDVPDTSATRWDTPVIGTWDLLDSSDREEDSSGAAPVNETTLRERIETLPRELLIPYDSRLEAQVNTYVVRHAGALRGMLGKYRHYEAMMRAAFRRQGIPEELAALALVESAMNPLALSPAGARGMWQFMPGTARRYGMRCDSTVDDRLDAVKATDAAARYLKAAYRRFGDWPLAISSYNCGPGSVENAIRKAGSREFWDIYPYLPRETKSYVPAFIAALYSVRFHSLHGIEPRRQAETPATVFIITREMTFDEVIEATGISRDELRRLNPQYLRETIPGNEEPHPLRIPRALAKLFRDNIDAMTDLQYDRN